MRTFKIILILMLFCTSLYGATITVTNTDDSGAGSLRQAITDATAGDIIEFSVTGTITISSSLTINKNLTIQGPGSSSLSINGNNSVRVFYVGGSAVVTINDLSIINGTAGNYGGGVENDQSTLTINDCEITGCTAGNTGGAGVDSYNGTVTINNTLLSGNTAGGRGGAVSAFGGSMTLNNCTLDNNHADMGGGIGQLQSTGNLTVTDCTISNNSADQGQNYGGGIYWYNGVVNITNTTFSGNSASYGGAISDGSASYTMTINACTIVNNSASTQGGGLLLRTATVNIKNTILASNTCSTGANYYSDGGTLTSQGYNLCDADLASFSGTGDITSGTLNIGSLADNGGSTKTHALSTGSDAIDAIPSTNSYNGIPSTDQIGTSRPQGTNADIGAYEKAGITVPIVTTTAASSITATSATGNGNVSSTGGANITERGIYWSTTDGFANGTGTKVSTTGDWSATGGFTQSISSLSPKTTYYVKAFATNSAGTSYGNQVSFTTPCASPLVHLFRSGSLVDDYCWIQDAIDASQDGDNIYIDAGTYTEQLTITTGIILQGAGRDLTIIESPNADQLAISGGNWKNMKNQDVFDIIGIKATNDVSVTIKDLKVDGRDQGFIPYPEYADNKGLYDFHGIGAYNTTVTIDNIYVTGIRNLASQFVTNQEDPNSIVPAGYLPTDQPAGINHNDAIFAESRSTASEHTFTLTNSYITQFQKTAVLVWGPTLTVDIHNNTIQGYGQTLWSTGNGIQVASSNRLGEGGENDDRRGTKGAVKDNQFLGMGIVIPEEGQDGYYFNPGLYSPAGVLLYEGGDNFVISGNTFNRSIKTKSWHVDFISNDGGYGNVAIDVVSSNGTVISNNTINGYDEAITTETASTTSSIIASNNTVLNSTIDYGTFPGANQITLGSNSEVLTYYHNVVGNNEISNFSTGDKIQVVKLATGVVNGMLSGSPSIDYSAGTVTEGDGISVAPYSVQVHYDGSKTYLYIDTDGSADEAELVLKLNGEYSTENFLLNGAFVEYQNVSPTVTTTAASSITVTSATGNGNVLSTGGANITERGIYWSTTDGFANGTGTKVSTTGDWSATGGFTQSISSLSPKTTYYVKAFATNSAGTSYGNQVSFTTPCASPLVHLFRSGSLVDDYCWIQDAIDASQDGDSIYIDAGTYTEQLTITTGIVLQGAGKDQTIIQSPDSDKLVVNGGWKTLKAKDMLAVIGIKTDNANQVKINGLTVDGMDQGYLPDATYPDKMAYAFQGIGAINTNLLVDDVKVTRVRALATDYSGTSLPAGYLPTDQPSGMNHNDAIFAESADGAGEHTLEISNTYIDKFQKDAILAWGPTLTVNIHGNTIQGYGQTIWSTGNGIQIASSNLSSGDRRGTKGAITNNQILDIGLVIPETEVLADHIGKGSPSGILLWEAGDGFIISGNTVSRTIQTKSRHVDFTSADSGYGSVGIAIAASKRTIVKDNTIEGYDEAIAPEAYGGTTSALIASNNTVTNNTIDYLLSSGPSKIELNNNHEVLTYFSNSPGNDTISNFTLGDTLQVVDLATGVVNGMLGGNPSIDYSSGTITAGDGTNVAALSMQVQTGSTSYLYIDTDNSAGAAELKIVLAGKYVPENFYFSGPYIIYKYTTPELTTATVTTPKIISASLGGEVTFDGGTTVTERGIVYNTTGTPNTTSDTKVQIGSGTGSFSKSVSGLTASTTYYVRAYAVNSEGTSYGNEEIFTTQDKETQTISFSAILPKTYGDASFTLADETTDKGLTVTYTATDPTVVSIVGNKATILKTGATKITATQAGNDIVAAATSVEQNLVVDKKALTITAKDTTKVYDGNQFSGFKVVYLGFISGEDKTSLDGSLAFSGTATTATDAGIDYVITPGGLTSDNYAITFVNGTLSITKATQVITFNEIPIKHLETDPDFNLDATSSSGLAVTYSYTYTAATAPAEVSPAGFVNLLASGEVEITASQEGNNNYLPAEPVTRTVTIESSDATIHSITINGVTYDTPDQEIYYLIDCSNEQDMVEINFETEANATENTTLNFEIEIPASGIYRKEIQVTSQDGTETINYHIIIEKSFSFDDIVIQKYNNVLIVNNNPETNGGYSFVSYQWYKDGVLIGTGQYYSAGENSDDLLDENAHYSVKITTEDGEELQTCDFAIEMNAEATLAVSPNPAIKGNVVNVSTTYSPGVLSTREVVIRNISGEVLYREISPENNSQVTLPPTLAPGTYIISTQAGGIILSSKLIVQ